MVFLKIKKILRKNYEIIFILFVALLVNTPNFKGFSLYPMNELYRDLAIEKSLDSGTMIFLGPPSMLGGFNFGPVYYFLLYPFVKIFNFASISLPIFSLFFFLGTIAISFFVFENWFKNRHLALLTSGLMGISILTYQFCQYGSNPNPIPFFMVLFLFALHRLLEGKSNSLNIFILGSSFAILTQLHAVPLVALPIILLWVLLRNKIYFNFKDVTIFALTVLVIYSPYLYFEASHNFENFRNLFSLATTTNTYAPLSIRLVEYFGFIISPFISIQVFFDIADFLVAYFFPSFFIFIFVGFTFWKFEKNRISQINKQLFKIELSAKLKQLLWLWFLVPTAVLLIPFGSVVGLRIYYFLMLYPLLYLVYAYCLLKLYFNGYRKTFYYLLGCYFIFSLYQIVIYKSLVNKIFE